MGANAGEAENRGTAGGGIHAEWSDLKDDVGGLADAAVTRGAGLAVAARDQALSFAERRKDDAARSLSDLAGTVRLAGDGMRDQPNVRAFFDQAAEGIDQLAGSLRERSFEEIWEEAERVMRRRPAAVALATFATGLLVSRFIKASAANLPTESLTPVHRAPDIDRGQT